MKVNSAAKVARLSAGRIDGKGFGAFGAKEVIDDPGPLSNEGTYTSKGGTPMILASWSGYRSAGSSVKEGRIGMDVRLHGSF